LDVHAAPNPATAAKRRKPSKATPTKPVQQTVSGSGPGSRNGSRRLGTAEGGPPPDVRPAHFLAQRDIGGIRAYTRLPGAQA